MSIEKRQARYARIAAELAARAAASPPITPEMWQQLAGLRCPRSPEDRAERKRVNWRHQANKRYAAKLRRTPPWADMEAIRELHAKARQLTVETGIDHHVDHIIPLQGRLVSGLHVQTNMQILTGSDNSKKWNHFDPWADSSTQGLCSRGLEDDSICS